MEVPLCIVLIILVILSGFFSAAETAYTSSSHVRIERLALSKKSAKIALYLVDHYERLLSSILIGNNVVNIASASIFTILAIEWFGEANGLDPEDLGKLNATLQGMQDSLNEITDEFNSSIDTLQKINEDLANLEDSKTQEEINLVGYKKLKTQFDEDIERLGFIVNAGDVLAQAPTVRKCSFCGSEIHSPAGDAKDQQQRIESAQAELDKTLLQSNTLVLEINSATERLSKYDSDIEKKNLEKDSITDRLNKKLQPAKSDFEFKISQIQSYLDLKSQIGAIERQTKDIDADKKVYNPDDVKLVDYQPKGLFSKQFFEDLEQTFLRRRNNSVGISALTSAEFPF
jgi:hypothetical protein